MTDEPGDRLRAVVFDLDGTLADTERDGHRVAFNEAFEAAGLPYRWDVEEYGRLLAITGGRRRLEHYLRDQGHEPAEAEALAADLHRDKTERFTALVRSGAVSARPGVRELIAELRAAGIATAVATTGRDEWVGPLLEQLFEPAAFDVVVTGDDVSELKPDPEVYHVTLRRLDTPARHTVAVEDSALGLQAALRAEVRCVVVPNDYTRDQDFTGAAAVLPDLRAGLDVATLRRALR